MGIANRIFNGKMNLDVQANRLPPSDYSDALNITRDAQGDAQDGVVSNILGNQKVSYTLRQGTHKVIGSLPDPVRNRIYYWIWNNDGYNLWLFYDRTTDTITKLIEDLTDTGNIPVLAFNPSKKINHSDIIYRDEGDLVSWTDGNTTPKEANVTTILAGTYGVIQSNFIEAAKMPPIHPPTCAYGNDTTRVSNSLRKKLFQFSHAWKYDTFAMSTPSTFSVIPLPIGEFGSDNDLDSSNNNFITITVYTGDKNVTDIEIYMRTNIGDAWDNFVTIISLNKAQLLIPDNSTYQFLFYNDNTYPLPTQNFQYVGGVQVVPLFDWVPQLADAQCQPNGNVKAYGAITENYDNYPVNDLDVTLTAENQTNIPPDADPPSITYTILNATIYFTVLGTFPVGTVIDIYVFFNGNPAIGETFGVRHVAHYVTIGGDTQNTVAVELYNQFNAFTSVPQIFGSQAANTWQITFGRSGAYVQQLNVVPGTSGSDISSQKVWLWGCPYILGIVYVDEQNRDIPGVTTYSNPAGSDDDFVVTTDPFSLDTGNPQTPVLSFSINHLPPADAVAYHLVRRRLAFGTFMFYETCDYQDGTDTDPDDKYLYFCLANIDAYKLANSQFIYGAAPVTNETRIKIVAGITAGAYDGTLYTAYDFQIIGVATRTLTGGTSPDNDVPFIKVVKPTAGISPAFQFNMLVMIYTPLANPTSDALSIYNEWGQTYDIYELNGVNYHRGLDQDQTASQPATFTFIEGDVYFRDRQMYAGLVATPPLSYDTLPLMDANYSDFFDSLVNDNGRAQAVEVNARKQFNGVLYRRSEAYQSGTNINGLNRFYPENFDEADRTWNNIVKMYIDRRYLYIGQTFNVGIIPVLQQIVTDTAGNPLQADSDILLNKIQYPYQKQFGYGNCPESFGYGKEAIYGFDNNKGIVWRLSQDGMIALSVLYDCNAFFVSKSTAYKSDLNNGFAPLGGVYTGNPTVYGTFDSYTNKYIIALEEINRYNSQGSLIFHQDPYTLTFLETRDESEGFESKVSYHPEGLESLNNLLVTFKNGEFWKHDSETYCSFYGVQYDAFIEGVFNDNVLEKKTWQSLTQISNTIWVCPLMFTNVNSFGSQRQETRLIEKDFTTFEQYPSAAILRDSKSRGGTYNGNFVKGGYIVIRFVKQNASTLVFLAGVSVKYVDSPLTVK